MAQSLPKAHQVAIGRLQREKLLLLSAASAIFVKVIRGFSCIEKPEVNLLLLDIKSESSATLEVLRKSF